VITFKALRAGSLLLTGLYIPKRILQKFTRGTITMGELAKLTTEKQCSQKSKGLVSRNDSSGNTAGESSKQALFELLVQFFQIMGKSYDDEKRLVPAYLNSLIKLDFELLAEVLLEMSDNWKDRFPSVPQIKDQYKLKKYRHQLRNSKKQEQQATTAGSKFWLAYNECKEQGIKDFRVIAKHLEASVTKNKEWYRKDING